MQLYPFFKPGVNSFRNYPRASPCIPNLDVHLDKLNVQFVPDLDKDKVDVTKLFAIGKVNSARSRLMYL